MLLLLALACVTSPPSPAVEAPVAVVEPPPPPPVWPEPGSVTAPELVLPAGFTPPVVMIDAGHGAPGNPGNTSVRCEEEEDEMLRIQEHVVERVRALGAAQVLTGREGEAKPSYKARVARAEAAGVRALVQLHSDARGEGVIVDERPPDVCVSNEGEPGFAILWSDEGEAALVAARHELARAIATRMTEAGFLPYDGAVYEGLYGGDEVPGVFVDRHVPRRRIYVLRRPDVPSVIVETHHAWDGREVARWNTPQTMDAFAGALGAALVDVEVGRRPH